MSDDITKIEGIENRMKAMAAELLEAAPVETPVVTEPVVTPPVETPVEKSVETPVPAIDEEDPIVKAALEALSEDGDPKKKEDKKEVKPATKAPVAVEKKEDATTTTPDEEHIKSASPKTKEHFARLKQIAEEERKKVETLTKELEEARKGADRAKLAEELEEEVKRLREVAKEVDLAHDPEIAKIDKVIGNTYGDVNKVLGKYPALAKAISTVQAQYAGDFAKAAAETTLMELLPKAGVTPSDVETVKILIDDARRAQLTRAKTYDTIKENYDTIKAQRAQEAQSRAQTDADQFTQVSARKMKEREAELAFAKPQTIDPADAPEVKKRKEDHNKWVADLGNEFKTKLDFSDGNYAEKISDLAIDSIVAKKLTREMAEKEAEIKAKNDLIEELTNRLRGVRKASSFKAGTSTTPKPVETTVPKNSNGRPDYEAMIKASAHKAMQEG